MSRPPFDYTLDFKNTDFRKHPELYRIGKGEQGVLLIEPYKSKKFGSSGGSVRRCMVGCRCAADCSLHMIRGSV